MDNHETNMGTNNEETELFIMSAFASILESDMAGKLRQASGPSSEYVSRRPPFNRISFGDFSSSGPRGGWPITDAVPAGKFSNGLPRRPFTSGDPIHLHKPRHPPHVNPLGKSDANPTGAATGRPGGVQSTPSRAAAGTAASTSQPSHLTQGPVPKPHAMLGRRTSRSQKILSSSLPALPAARAGSIGGGGGGGGGYQTYGPTAGATLASPGPLSPTRVSTDPRVKALLSVREGQLKQVNGWRKPPNRLLMRMVVTQLLAEESQRRVQQKLRRLDMNEIDKILLALEADQGGAKSAASNAFWTTLKLQSDVEWAKQRAEELVSRLRRDAEGRIAKDFLARKQERESEMENDVEELAVETTKLLEKEAERPLVREGSELEMPFFGVGPGENEAEALRDIEEATARALFIMRARFAAGAGFKEGDPQPTLGLDLDNESAGTYHPKVIAAPSRLDEGRIDEVHRKVHVRAMDASGDLKRTGQWLDTKLGFGPQAAVEYTRSAAAELAERMGTTERGRRHLFHTLRGIDPALQPFEQHLVRPDALSRHIRYPAMQLYHQGVKEAAAADLTPLQQAQQASEAAKLIRTNQEAEAAHPPQPTVPILGGHPTIKQGGGGTSLAAPSMAAQRMTPSGSNKIQL